MARAQRGVLAELAPPVLRNTPTSVNCMSCYVDDQGYLVCQGNPSNTAIERALADQCALDARTKNKAALYKRRLAWQQGQRAHARKMMQENQATRDLLKRQWRGKHYYGTNILKNSLYSDSTMKRTSSQAGFKQRPGKKRYNSGGRQTYYPMYKPVPSNIIKYQQTHPGGEIKALDVVNSTTPTTNTVSVWTLNSTPKIQALNLITIGSSQWNRVGRKVTMKSVRIRGFLVATGNASTAEIQYGRVMIIYDKQPNGALPQISDVLLDQVSVASDSSISTLTSGLNLNNRDRFEVLIDRQFVLPNTYPTNETANLSATADLMHLDIFRKLGNREVHFKADSSPAVIGDIATGSLVMITYGNDASGGEAYSLQASVRVRYSDL